MPPSPNKHAGSGTTLGERRPWGAPLPVERPRPQKRERRHLKVTETSEDAPIIIPLRKRVKELQRMELIITALEGGPKRNRRRRPHLTLKKTEASPFFVDPEAFGVEISDFLEPELSAKEKISSFWKKAPDCLIEYATDEEDEGELPPMEERVEAFAKQLGLDPYEDHNLMFLAKNNYRAAMPLGWVAGKDALGKDYWEHILDGSIVRTDPRVLFLRTFIHWMRNHATLIIQARWHRYRAGNRYAAVLKIQTVFRGVQARVEVAPRIAQKRAVIRIQSVYRRYRCRKIFLELLMLSRLAIMLQSRVRRRMAAKVYQTRLRMKREKAALAIQNAWRPYISFKRERDIIWDQAARKIQRCVVAFLERRRFRRSVVNMRSDLEATRIQAWARGCLARKRNANWLRRMTAIHEAWEALRVDTPDTRGMGGTHALLGKYDDFISAVTLSAIPRYIDNKNCPEEFIFPVRSLHMDYLWQKHRRLNLSPLFRPVTEKGAYVYSKEALEDRLRAKKELEEKKKQEEEERLRKIAEEKQAEELRLQMEKKMRGRPQGKAGMAKRASTASVSSAKSPALQGPSADQTTESKEDTQTEQEEANQDEEPETEVVPVAEDHPEPERPKTPPPKVYRNFISGEIFHTGQRSIETCIFSDFCDRIVAVSTRVISTLARFMAVRMEYAHYLMMRERTSLCIIRPSPDGGDAKYIRRDAATYAYYMVTRTPWVFNVHNKTINYSKKTAQMKKTDRVPAIKSLSYLDKSVKWMRVAQHEHYLLPAVRMCVMAEPAKLIGEKFTRDDSTAYIENQEKYKRRRAKLKRPPTVLARALSEKIQKLLPSYACAEVTEGLDAPVIALEGLLPEGTRGSGAEPSGHATVRDEKEASEAQGENEGGKHMDQDGTPPATSRSHHSRTSNLTDAKSYATSRHISKKPGGPLGFAMQAQSRIGVKKMNAGELFFTENPQVEFFYHLTCWWRRRHVSWVKRNNPGTERYPYGCPYLIVRVMRPEAISELFVQKVDPMSPITLVPVAEIDALIPVEDLNNAHRVRYVEKTMLYNPFSKMVGDFTKKNMILLPEEFSNAVRHCFARWSVHFKMESNLLLAMQDSRRGVFSSWVQDMLENDGGVDNTGLPSLQIPTEHHATLSTIAKEHAENICERRRIAREIMKMEGQDEWSREYNIFADRMAAATVVQAYMRRFLAKCRTGKMFQQRRHLIDKITNAAVCIESAFRGYRHRKNNSPIMQLLEGKRVERHTAAAVNIQRIYRAFAVRHKLDKAFHDIKGTESVPALWKWVPKNRIATLLHKPSALQQPQGDLGVGIRSAAVFDARAVSMDPADFNKIRDKSRRETYKTYTPFHERAPYKTKTFRFKLSEYCTLMGKPPQKFLFQSSDHPKLNLDYLLLYKLYNKKKKLETDVNRAKLDFLEMYLANAGLRMMVERHGMADDIRDDLEELKAIRRERLSKKEQEAILEAAERLDEMEASAISEGVHVSGDSNEIDLGADGPLRAAFENITHGDPAITSSHLEEFLRGMGKVHDAEAVENIMSKWDKDESGAIEFPEFVEWHLHSVQQGQHGEPAVTGLEGANSQEATTADGDGPAESGGHPGKGDGDPVGGHDASAGPAVLPSPRTKGVNAEGTSDGGVPSASVPVSAGGDGELPVVREDADSPLGMNLDVSAIAGGDDEITAGVELAGDDTIGELVGRRDTDASSNKSYRLDSILSQTALNQIKKKVTGVGQVKNPRHKERRRKILNMVDRALGMNPDPYLFMRNDTDSEIDIGSVADTDTEIFPLVEKKPVKPKKKKKLTKVPKEDLMEKKKQLESELRPVTAGEEFVLQRRKTLKILQANMPEKLRAPAKPKLVLQKSSVFMHEVRPVTRSSQGSRSRPHTRQTVHGAGRPRVLSPINGPRHAAEADEDRPNTTKTHAGTAAELKSIIARPHTHHGIYKDEGHLTWDLSGIDDDSTAQADMHDHGGHEAETVDNEGSQIEKEESVMEMYQSLDTYQFNSPKKGKHMKFAEGLDGVMPSTADKENRPIFTPASTVGTSRIQPTEKAFEFGPDFVEELLSKPSAFGHKVMPNKRFAKVTDQYRKNHFQYDNRYKHKFRTPLVREEEIQKSMPKRASLASPFELFKERVKYCPIGTIGRG